MQVSLSEPLGKGSVFGAYCNENSKITVASGQSKCRNLDDGRSSYKTTLAHCDIRKLSHAQCRRKKRLRNQIRLLQVILSQHTDGLALPVLYDLRSILQGQATRLVGVVRPPQKPPSSGCCWLQTSQKQ